MKIAVSSCLLGINYKYNGGNNYSEKLEKLLEKHEVIPICPEVLGGLPIPRDPSEIVNGEVLTDKGKSVDKEFRNGAKKALEIVIESGAELVVLQPRSPSCGLGEIYDGSFTGRLVDGDGVFVKLLKDEGIKVVDVGDFINEQKS